MMMMSEDDVAYSALLAQLLSDSAPSRNARVHSWIEHQYDFVLSEQSNLPFASSRPPSPSPSSSLGAHRAPSIDRPDSPLLPRFSHDRASSPCPSYDALFFPAKISADDDFEEKERVRALHFIVQEMAHWKSHASHPHPHDKPLPAPPPSPASTTQSSPRAMRSRSSSTCISRLPSFTSTLSSDQSQPQDTPPPLPVSLIVHGEYQHDLVLRDRPIVDGYLHRRDDSYPHSFAHAQDHEAQYLYPAQDDKDSFQPSPTLSNFSLAYSRETSFTTPYPSSPASPTSAVFSSSPCLPENVALPASPVDEEQPFFREVVPAPIHDRTPSSKSSQSFSSLAISPPKTNVLPASPISDGSAFENGAPHHLRALKPATDTQSRWSVATTASLAPSTAEPKRADLLDPKSASKNKKSLKPPKKRARFISLISRLSPGRTDPSSTTSSLTGDDVECESIIDSDSEDREKRLRKPMSKKPSLASLRASFSLSRASFSSQRPPVSSPVEEVPPLPTSPTLPSSMVEPAALSETTRPVTQLTLSKKPSKSNLLNSNLPPIPQSASTITTFQSASRISVSDASAHSWSESRVSLVCPATTPNGSRISLLPPPPSKRTSLASAAGIQPVASIKPAPANKATPARSKSIFRLTAKPKSLKTPATPGFKEAAMPSKLPVAGNSSLPSPTTARSRIPQAPAKFNPPAKLATVIATQSRQAPALASPGPTSPTSKLPMPPSRTSKVPRPAAISEKKPPAESLPSLSSRLPMPASVKGARVGTVKGFWKRQ